MRHKYLKTLIFMALGLMLLAPLIWVGVIAFATHRAESKAQDLIQSAYSQYTPTTDDEKIIALAKTVYTRFDHNDPNHSLLLRLRPYLTNKRLPSFLRLPNGVIETEIETGLCDNAARMLSFMLNQEGYASLQWNMVTDSAGHSALLVTTPDGREGFVDPFYGYYATQTATGELISANEAQTKMRAGQQRSEIFMPFDESSKSVFYDNFATAMMAGEGFDLRIEATLPKLEHGEPLILGEINDAPKDVMKAAMTHGMTPYWQYMGHRYNREWVRVLKASEPVKIVMTLTAPAEKSVLTATPAPIVNGNKLTWTLNSGDEITFRDGLARISLKRMNSYIDVDQIAVYPID